MSRIGSFGRLPAPPDGRDNLFRMASAMRQLTAAAPPKPRKARYREGPLLDQGSKPHCVAFSGAGFLYGAPIMTKPGTVSTANIYNLCQKADEWPGENYDGTSVRALMKVLQAQEHINSYVWGQTVDEMVAWILGGYGTVIVGTNWYAEMDNVDADDVVQMPGSFAWPIGGHAYRIVWWDKKKDRALVRNSWGPLWGILKRDGTRSGEAWLTREAVERLLHEEGEIAAATQVRVKAVIV